VRFAHEFWLYLVPLVPMLWLVFRAADRKTHRRMETLLGANASSHVEGINPRLQTWRRFFYLTGVFWLLIALARPQWGANEVSVVQRGSDIIIALDISNSMLAEDVLPNRMGRAITELSSFLNRLEDSRVGLVFFAGSAFVQCPLTLDYGTAEIFLKMAGPDMMSQQGTAIGSALETSRHLLGKGRESGVKNNFQAILLVTDGEDLEGNWESEAEACKSEGIKVIPVGVGDKGGGLIPAFDAKGRSDGFLKDDEGNVVMSRLDLVALEKMASIGGGSSFLIGVDGLAGDRLFSELQRLGKRDLEERRISSFKERFVWPLLLAVVCFVLRLTLYSRRQNRPQGTFPLAGRHQHLGALLLALVPLLWGSTALAGLRPPGGADATQGRELYLAGQFEQALEKFEEAIIQAPEDPLISLALGETLHQLERFEEAGVEFDRALDLASDPGLKAEALYNRGTTRLAAGETDQAVEDLMASLQWDPAQSDALHNLEVALRRMEQEQQQQQENQEQQQNEDQKQDEEQEGEKKDQQENQDQENKEEQQEQEEQEQDQEENQDQEEKDKQQQEPQQNQEQQEQQQQEQEQNQPQEESEEMPKEQALQLLKALDRDEEELKRSVQKRLKGGRPKSGKKW
jgi:Ca-activated chloride channel homolog